ncbi:MAG: hypothetical protein Q6373_025205 [Candidatus Sigynarchaeota archaeon]
MSDESLTMASMNWRLVEDAKEAMSRGDWMLALSLFEQSRRICIDEGWREGVHYADDMILNVYPMVKRQIDESNRIARETPADAAKSVDSPAMTHQPPYFHAAPRVDSPIKGQKEDAFDDSGANRRLRRMIGDGKGNLD